MENGYLLISDLDGTLLGDEIALRKFAAWHEGRRDALRIVYCSGRFAESILESIESTDLPEPVAIIGGVGTQVIDFRSRTPFENWPTPNDGWNPDRIRDALADFRGLVKQPDELSSEFKISYYLHDASPYQLKNLLRCLEASQCDIEIVYSSNRDLDILPRGVNKGSAAAFLASQWSLSRDRVCVAGDTGNDVAMFQHGFRGIVVGNAREELKNLSDSNVYHANAWFAGGVLEGLEHWMDRSPSRKIFPERMSTSALRRFAADR